MTVTNAQPVVCRIDLVPAVVTFTAPDSAPESFDQARVIVTADRIYVYRDGRPPYTWYEGRIESFEGRNTIGYQVVTADGSAIFFRRGSGCLCGSQLRSFRPFPQGLVQGKYVSS